MAQLAKVSKKINLDSRNKTLLSKQQQYDEITKQMSGMLFI